MNRSIRLYSFLPALLMICMPVLLEESLTAQREREMQAINVGDRVPDIRITNILNYPGKEVSLSAFKGRLVIIDFWGTTCSSCIAALPGIEQLQQQFKDRLQVLTVTDFDDAEKVTATLQRFRSTRNVKLPVIINDDQLQRLFPYELVSHVVWIDGNGIVKAITGTDYITAENIQAVLNGERINWPVKKDFLDFDYEKPLLSFTQPTTAENNPPVFYSAFTGHLAGVSASDMMQVDSVEQTVTRNYFNHTLLALCNGAINGTGTGYVNPKKLVLEVPDPSKYLMGHQYRADWEMRNTYTYSVVLPLHFSKEKTHGFIREDLSRWLQTMDITVALEKRLSPCLLLKRTSLTSAPYLSKGGPYLYDMNDTAKVKTLQNATIKSLLWHFNQERPNVPWMFDETGIAPETKIDIRLPLATLNNIETLRKALQVYGLDVEPAERIIKKIVVREQKASEHPN